MPKIRITFSELTTEILTFPKNKEITYEIWNHILMNGFIFNEFTLVIEPDAMLAMLGYKGRKNTYKVKIKGVGEEQKIYIKEIWINEKGLARSENIETNIPNFLEEITEVIENCYELGIARFVDWDVNKPSVVTFPPMMFMQYAVNKAMNREIIEMPTTEKRYKPISERKNTKQKTEYKLFDVIRKYSQHINHNKHNITCERWEVKGHFRHYKNGKVVYVKPFEKGKGRKKEREYKL